MGSRTKCRVGSWVTGMVPSKLLADGNEGLELPEYIYIQLLQHCLLYCGLFPKISMPQKEQKNWNCKEVAWKPKRVS